MLLAGKSINGGWNNKQVMLLGEDMTVSGWFRRLTGKDVSLDAYNEFLSLTNAHLNKSSKVDRAKLKNAHIPADPNLPWAEQYKHPNWQRVRLAILKRDKFRCVECGDNQSTLHVHHIKYRKSGFIWDVPKWYLVTLCEGCHSEEHGRDLR